jgi:hypothetical protein
MIFGSVQLNSCYGAHVLKNGTMYCVSHITKVCDLLLKHVSTYRVLQDPQTHMHKGKETYEKTFVFNYLSSNSR